MTVTIDLRSLPAELVSTANALGDGAERAMRRAARYSIGLVQQAINDTEPYPPVDTGQYRQAWQVDDVPGGADLFNPTIQAAVIEFGARPHVAPIQPLLEWAERKVRAADRAARKAKAAQQGRAAGSAGRGVKKPSNGRTSAAGKKKRANKVSAERQARAEALAWKAWDKIRVSGAEPKEIMTSQQPAMLLAVDTELDRELTRALNKR